VWRIQNRRRPSSRPWRRRMAVSEQLWRGSGTCQ
jgi:hypothetical protein